MFLVRWMLDLANYEFEIRHVEGIHNPADALSRRPDLAAISVAYHHDDWTAAYTADEHYREGIRSTNYQLQGGRWYRGN